MKKLIALFACIALPALVWAQITVSISTVNITCNSACDGSATASASGGTPPYTYSWNPVFGNTPGISGLCPGTYTVTVTDQLNVQQTQTCVITQPNALSLTINPFSPSICEGSSVSFTTMVSGGVGPYSFSWSFPGGSPSSSNLQNPTVTYNTAGMYNANCTVTDASGCVSYSTVTVNVAAPTVGGSVAGSASYCSTTNSGTLTLSGHTGNVVRWEFSTDGGLTWVNIANTTTTQTYTNVAQDRMYRARVQSGACPAAYSSTANVYIFPQPNIVLTPSNTAACTNSSFTVTATGAMSYMWQPGNFPTNPFFTLLSSTTTYTCIGTDMNGCIDTATITISALSNPTVITSEIPATCNGVGTVSATAAGGNPPYAYTWTPGNLISSSITVAPNQTYTVDVTDANGCTAQATQFLSDSCDYVWPGDANDDGVADNVDILDIGIANGATGTPRANATTAWIGQPSAAWGTTLLSGTDYKWVDCDGSGTIDLVDTQAVTLNYGYVHNNRYAAPSNVASAPDLSISFDQDTLAAGQSGTLTLSLGNASIPASNVYGIAFRLNYDAAQLSTPSFGITGGTTWIGTPGSDLMRVVLHPNAAMGFVDVAITRYDHQNVSGNGNIAQLYFTATNTQAGTGAGEIVSATLSNVVIVDNTGTTQVANVINDDVVVADSAIITTVNPVETATILVYPNPANGQLQLQLPAGDRQLVTIEDVSGRVVYSQYHPAGTSTISVSGLADGVYMLRAVNAEGNAVTERVAVKH